MRSLLERLTDQGYEIYVLTAGSLGYTPPSFDSDRIHYQPILPRSQRSLFSRYIPLSVLLAHRALRLARRLKPAWIIAALPTGLLAATPAAVATGAKRIYFSLELYPSSETKGLGPRIIKTLEKWANRSAQFTIIQDMYRGQQLIDDHKLDPQRVFQLPNAHSGRAAEFKSDYLRKRFKIPPHDRVILYAGGIADWAESADLLQSALAWPRDWHLVFHSPQLRANDPYIAALRAKADNGHVHFSLDPLAQQQMDELVSSADVGLALYKTGYGLNNYLIGHSAGKISQYLRCHLPVIVSDLPSLRAWVQRFRCGLCIQTPAQVGSAIEKIFTDYSQYQHNATRCFQELLKPDRYLDTIVLRLQESPQAPE